MSLIPIGSPLAQWDPFNQFGNLYDKFNALFNGQNGLPAEVQWTPAMDIVENEHEILVRMDTPGMERKDLKVELNEGLLVISGERKYEHKDEKDSYYRLERGYGSFMRNFRLPDYIDQGHIRAECKDGLLQVHLAKIPGKKKEVKSIAIN
ncbi:Hsp20/alpha crystallin family protein [Rheinheimera sp.]|uniref:Hsp20/alpha crystallin family protein n=1 Tax=Rheinheimera sp. TaxID=1869214 RepID=UPI0027333E9F|nr:Hsp20/alpha crystallin family protein [Rheinheimera sp.]MDP2715469.1 Hsp20/alpha crystallin family protein [Rheinheimera sp.]